MTIAKAGKFILINVILLVIIFALQSLYNFLTYDLSGPMTWVLNQSGTLNANGDFIRAISWYLLQIGVTCLLIRFILHQGLREAGFNTWNVQLSRKYIRYFVVLFPFIVAACLMLIYFTLGPDAIIGQYAGRDAVYAVKDIAVYGTLPGLGEEPFFRIFVIQFLLMYGFNKRPSLDSKAIHTIILLSAVYFMLGHIHIGWSPLSLRYDVIQLITAFVLGIFYAVTYLRTRSILAAVVCHSYSDFVIFLMGYLVYFYHQ